MFYFNEEAYDMLLILGESQGTFATVERLWRERYPDRTQHLRRFFNLTKRFKIKGVVQPQYNETAQIHPIMDERKFLHRQN